MLYRVEARKLNGVSAKLQAETWVWKSPNLPAERERPPDLTTATGEGHGSSGNESTCNVGDLGSIPGLGRYPGEGKGYHSSILAWGIPWTEEPGGL